MVLIAVILDSGTANGQALLKLLPELDGKASCICGNNLEDFKGSPQLPEIDAIILAVFAGGQPSVIADIWPLCPNVRWIHSMAAGVDTLVPVINSLPRGPEVPVTNAKGAFSSSLAEYALAAMLHFNKQIPRLQSNRTTKTWDRFIMGELRGQTVGFIGFGDIAQTTARLCKAFGMQVMALRNSRGQPGNELADVVCYASDAPDGKAKEEVFRQSDYVICTLPGGPATYHACGASEFAVMKTSAVFISMGRGSCVDEAALVDVLKGGKIAGAALDVFEKEPLAPESPLWHCDNLLLSPHNADLTETYMKLAWDVFLKRLAEYTSPSFSHFEGVVDKTKGY
eukprot:TRINITY_DN68352_c0_g1_i1.p1 TRINITY_DN68352_c0_g1~~TRINITY_DN68352_c0_g1_i1.p1  ORF type:complete len:340 (+),score=65.40 TRINITY_DN68352_c0_g1_i1:63-1082(+)